MRKVIIISVLVCIISADVSVQPYAPSNWRPTGALFTLPSQFLPARQTAQVEITKENVELAGQLNEVSTTQNNQNIFPGYTYLPPTDIPEDVTDQTTTENNLRVQGLPKRNFGNNNQNQNQNKLNQNNQNQFGNLQNQNQFGNLQNQNNFGRLRILSNQQQLRNNQQFGSNQQFGKQISNTNVKVAPKKPQDAEQTPESQININENENDNDDENETQNNSNNNSNENKISSNGQYYILTPDNTLQRVTFMTSQNEDEARINGFTAQLQYMPVEPIRDPIYLYNKEGQLVRIFK